MVFNLSTLIFGIKTYTLPLDIFSLDGDGFHPKIEIEINGVKQKAILDTGASKTAFDHDLLQAIAGEQVFHLDEKLSTGLGTNSMQCFKATIDLKLGDLSIPNYYAAVLDLSHINIAYEKLGLEKVIGVIGSDILVRYKAIVDYENKVLTLKV
ncbi:aspartyl protease family protein [Solitalea sp. MAHUQ-68]|uniref:Aspartyl protease family protein n=1 Tax=Solitalea agri TaxID=2953739 RepID=A0A9X2JEG4_9SPHI|nr:aspartyl protease family protein [Solitalea agri]MCO4293920.1 aspartyl protease family protein [Solitalea agri]